MFEFDSKNQCISLSRKKKKKKKTRLLISLYNGSQGVQNPKRKRSKLQADNNGYKDKEKEPLITAFREQRLLPLDGCVWMKVSGILAWNQITSNFSEIKSYLGLNVLFTHNLARIGL